jgi:hypothetical protein
MKNPFASLKKLKKKEVIVFAVILFLLLIFFVIRKQKGGSVSGGGGEIAMASGGDSNETRNQIADMGDQNNLQIENLKSDIVGLKDGINDIISYNGQMQNQVPLFENMFAQFDSKLDAVQQSNDALKETINDSTKNVAPSAPPANKNSIFKTGSYGTAESASKALTFMTSWGGKNGSIVRNDDGSYRAVATYDDQAKSQRVGENLSSKGLVKVYYAGGNSPEQKTIAVTKKSTPKPVPKTAPKTAPKPVTKPVVPPKKK